jgi:hypothetical protein
MSVGTKEISFTSGLDSARREAPQRCGVFSMYKGEKRIYGKPLNCAEK